MAELVVSRGRRDLTAEVLDGVCPSELDRDQFRRLRRTIRGEAQRRDLAELGDEDLTNALGLAHGARVTRAAVLLLGSRALLARHAPRHEVIFTRNNGTAGYDVRRESLSLGKDLPRYEHDESHVKLVLPTRSDGDFARLVLEVRGSGGNLDLDDLIVLRGLVRRRYLVRRRAAAAVRRGGRSSSRLPS